MTSLPTRISERPLLEPSPVVARLLRPTVPLSERISERPLLPTTADRLGHAASQAAGAFVSTFGAVPTAAAEVTRLVRLPSSVPRELHRWGDAVRGFAEETFPGNPELQGSFWWDTVPEGIGSFGAFILAGAAGSLVGGPVGATVTAGTLAGASGIAEQSLRLRPFVQSGELSEEAANLAAIAGVIPGLIQVFPVLRGVNQILGKKAGSVVWRTFNKSFTSRLKLQVPYVTKEAGALAVEEALTEVVGAIGQNAIERIAVNKQRGLLDEVVTAGGAGGVAGFLTGIATTAIGLGRSGRLTRRMTQTEAGRRVLHEQAISEGLLTEDESEKIGQDVGLFFDVIQARLDDKQVSLKPIEAGVTGFAEGDRVWVGEREESYPGTVTAEERTIDINGTPTLQIKVNLDKPTPIQSLPRGVAEEYLFEGDPQGRITSLWVSPRVLKEMQGTGQYKAEVKTDVLTLRERQALENPDLEQRIREARDDVGPPASVQPPGSRSLNEATKDLFVPDAKKPGSVRLDLPEINARGLLRDPAKLVPEIKLRERIRKLQHSFVVKLLRVLQEPAIDKRKWAKDKLESQFVVKMDRILGKSDDTLKGALKQLRGELGALAKRGELPQAKAIRADLNRIVREMRRTLIDRNGQLESLHIIAAMSANSELMPRTQALIKKIAGNWKAQPYALRVASSVRRIEGILRGDLKVLSREDLRAAIRDIPPEHVRPLLEKLPSVKTIKERTEWLNDAKEIAERWLHSTAKNELLDLVAPGNLSNTKNPRYNDVLRTITRFFRAEVRAVSGKLGYDPITNQLVPATPGGLTAVEQTTLEIATDERRFEALGPGHKFFNERWNALVELEALTREQARFLRYLFTGTSDKVMRRARDISQENPFSSYAGTYRHMLRGITLASGKGGRPAAVHTFAHEFFHLAHYTHLGESDALIVSQLWKKLTARKVKPPFDPGKSGIRVWKDGDWRTVPVEEWTEAHELFIQTSPEPTSELTYSHATYFAHNPNEFFAELGARWFLESQTTLPVLKRIFALLTRPLLSHANRLNNLGPTVRVLPTELKAIFERTAKGLGELEEITGADWILHTDEKARRYASGALTLGLDLPMLPAKYGPGWDVLVDRALRELYTSETGRLRLARLPADLAETYRYLVRALVITEHQRGGISLRAYNRAISTLNRASKRYRDRLMTTLEQGIPPKAIDEVIEEWRSKGTLTIPAGADRLTFLERLNLRAAHDISAIDVGATTTETDMVKLHLQTSRLLEEIRAGRNELPPAGVSLALPALTEVKPPKLIRRTKTGQPRIDRKALAQAIEGLSTNEVQILANRVKSIIRKGQIEKGLYRSILKWSAEDDLEEALNSISPKAKMSDFRRKWEVPVGIIKTVGDPSTIEGWLLQTTGGRENVGMRRIFFNEFEKPETLVWRHERETRVFARKITKKVYGRDISHWRGYDKFLKYMQERLSNGIYRSEAMWAYALQTDLGLAPLVRRDGIEARGKRFDLDESVALLSDKDKVFMDELRTFFQKNPWIEKAFDNHRLLRGFEAERSPSGYFPAVREYIETKLAGDHDPRLSPLESYGEIAVTKSTGHLEARNPNVRSPFKLDGGALGVFYRTADNLARYAELGQPMYRAETLLKNPTFKREFIARFGQTRWDHLRDYLKNILGFIGHSPSTFDAVMTYIPHAWMTSKIALNITSAIRQTLSLMTAMGDTILEKGAITRALVEGAGFSRRVGATMRDKSGLAFMRLEVGRFAEALVVLGDRNPTSRLTNLQNEAFVLQRMMDDWSLRVTWRAAEIMADKRGLQGQAREDFIVDRFEKSLIRNQASNSPLYASPLEIEAKKHPLLRGTLALQRELNRLYNVVRRHVVTAAQNPTRENVIAAGNALFWVGIANTGASVGLSLLRLAAFGLPLWGLGEIFKRSIQELAGRWYVLNDATVFFMEFGGKGQRYAAERLLGPAGSITLDVAHTGNALVAAFQAGSKDVEDAERYFRSGPRRGQDKFLRNLETAADHGLSALSAVLGLPFWAVWFQAKGLYNWKREDYRLLVHLETEYQKAPEGSIDRAQIEKVKERINRVHRMRERGLLTSKQGRDRVIAEIRLHQSLTR